MVTKSKRRRTRLPELEAPLQPEAGESRRDRFFRIGQPRMNRVLNSIRLLGNLASPNYDFNSDDIARMRTAIDEQLNKTFLLFERRLGRAARTAEFSFGQRQKAEAE